MFPTHPLQKPEFVKQYRALCTALGSAFGLGMDAIKAIDHYRHMGPKISNQLLVASTVFFLVLLATSVRTLLRYLRNEAKIKLA